MNFNYYLIFILLLSACVASGPSSNKRGASTSTNTSDSTSSEENDDSGVDTSNIAPYFKYSGNTLTSTLSIPADLNDLVYLRGSKISNYIIIKDNKNPQCIISYFSTSTDKQILLTAARPNFFYNFETQSQEYYYLLNFNDSTINQTFCQKPGILNYLSNSYPGLSVTYSTSSLCSSCTTTNFISEAIGLVTSDGISLSSEVGLTNLKVNILNQDSTTGGNTDPSLFCSSSNDCLARDYDCCSLGQCVKDKQLKSSVDTTSDDYLQALLDINNNSNNIYNYPNYFHLCSIRVYPTPTPEPTTNPEEDAQDRFSLLQSYYNCTTSIEGEMGLCHIRYDDISTDSTDDYATSEDDRSFSTIYSGTAGYPTHSIYEVTYAGETLFQDSSIIKGMSIGTGNDSVTDTQLINISYSPAASAPNDQLEIIFKVDASCEKESSGLAKCYKEYTQGENIGKVTDHYPASNQFDLPYYADTTKPVKVEVNTSKKLQGNHWDLILGSPSYVEFIGASLQVYDTEIVKISYYVNLNTHPNVLLKKQEALDKIVEYCQCSNDECRLTPVLDDDEETILNYECYYPPQGGVDVPLQQTVILDSKTVPVRYFDEDGVPQSDVDLSTSPSEGTSFVYTNNDLLKPNNVENHIGFNEIYGTLGAGFYQASAAKEVILEKNKNYDLVVISGVFSTCSLCGTDYYSNLARIFPTSFSQPGGGYSPDLKTTDPFSTTTYRKDDLLFGRSCFVPATMIPWSHDEQSTRQSQRLGRMASQHFLFANGYQRDWYGFDYGSVIGSFDGVNWFSVGSNRRIKATTTKLFLAINAYFGDLGTSNTFQVFIQDASNSPDLPSIISSDIESSGAQCQLNHICETDTDCISQLGWDYMCESVSNIQTIWPVFDDNADEIPNTSNTLSLTQLFQTKTPSGMKGNRCVYRGKGSICRQNYEISDSSISYAGSTSPGLHYCSANNYCQQFVDGVPASRFNTKIARYGKTVRTQNASSTVLEDDLDLIGTASRIIGRPYDLQGTDQIPTDAQRGLTNNNANAICIPGREPSDNTFVGQHAQEPTSEYISDLINGIGVTPSSGTTQSYLSSCSIIGGNGDYLFKELSSSTMLSSIQNYAGTQAIPTNALEIFESASLSGRIITKDFEAEYIDSFHYQENRCLRAPGSVCFSDLECAPNKNIASKVAGLNPDDTSITSIINRYEILFWQEHLVCSQEYEKDDSNYDVKNNRCCRETGNLVTIATATNTLGTVDVDTSNIPSLGTVNLSDRRRYFRYSSVYEDMQSSATNYPPVEVVANDSCDTTCGTSSSVEMQWNTLSETASRTCCSKHWVRNFSDENGGGHEWGPTKTQNIPKASFKCLNWNQCTSDAANFTSATNTCGTSFTCDHRDNPDDAGCLVYSTPPSEAAIVFNWVGRLELTGIPQILIDLEDTSNIEPYFCKVDPNDQSVGLRGTDTLPPGLVSIIGSEPAEYENGSSEKMYSAGDPENFDDTNIKTIFSRDETVCCIPAGDELPEGADAKQCCTGFVNQENGLCQLPDYSNISVYLNRYVSSAADYLADSRFDSETGYLNLESDAKSVACFKNICASGRLAKGVSLSNLQYPGHENNPEDKRVLRFIDGEDAANNPEGQADLFDAGLKWNTHYYCFPEAPTIPSSNYQDPSGIINCN